MAKSIYNSLFDKNKTKSNNASINDKNLEKDSKDSNNLTDNKNSESNIPSFKQKKAIVIETQNTPTIIPQTTIVQHQTQTFFDPAPANPTVITPANTLVTATMTQPAMTAVN